MGSTIVCFGEVLLRLSAPGRELLMQSARFDAHVGGAEANVAVGLCRLGHRVSIVSALPDSPLGEACAGELRRHGVDTHALRRREGRMGLYFYTHGAGHRAGEVLYDRSGSVFASAPADLYDWPQLLEGARWLHVSGITPAVSAAAAEATLAAMRAAREIGVKVSFDCNFRPRLWGPRASAAPGMLRALCALADIIFGDERDVALILGTVADVSASREHARRAAADAAFGAFEHLSFMACTERARQSVDVQELTGILHDRRATYVSRTYPLHNVVDRIGAGDAFAAGVLHGLLEGVEPQAVIELGAAAGCLKHSIPGDFSLASAADLELLLSQPAADVRR